MDMTKDCHTFKYKVMSNMMNLFGFITGFLTATLTIMEKFGCMFV